MSKIGDFIERGGGMKNFILATLRGAGEDPFRHIAETFADKIKPYLPEVAKGKLGGALSGLAASYAQFATPDRTPMTDIGFDFFEYMRRGLYNGSVPRLDGWISKFEEESRQYINRVAEDDGDLDEAITKIEATRDAHQKLDGILAEMKPPPAGEIKVDWESLLESMRSFFMREGDDPDASTGELLKKRFKEFDQAGAQVIMGWTKELEKVSERLTERQAERERRSLKNKIKRFFTG